MRIVRGLAESGGKGVREWGDDAIAEVVGLRCCYSRLACGVSYSVPEFRLREL